MFAIIARFLSSQPPGLRPDTPPGGPEQQGGLPAVDLVPPPQAQTEALPGLCLQQGPAVGSEQLPPQGGSHPLAALPGPRKGGRQHAGAPLPAALKEARPR